MAHQISLFSISHDYDDLFEQQEIDAASQELYSAQSEITKLKTQVQVLTHSSAKAQEDLEVTLLADQMVQVLNRKEIENRDKEIENLSSQVKELKATKASDANILAAKVDQLTRRVEQFQGEASKAPTQLQVKLLEENRSLTARLAAAEAKNKELERRLQEAEQQAKATAERLTAQNKKDQEQLAADKAKTQRATFTAEASLAAALERKP